MRQARLKSVDDAEIFDLAAYWTTSYHVVAKLRNSYGSLLGQVWQALREIE
jgi:hypothetical protein